MSTGETINAPKSSEEVLTKLVELLKVRYPACFMFNGAKVRHTSELRLLEVFRKEVFRFQYGSTLLEIEQKGQVPRPMTEAVTTSISVVFYDNGRRTSYTIDGSENPLPSEVELLLFSMLKAAKSNSNHGGLNIGAGGYGEAAIGVLEG